MIIRLEQPKDYREMENFTREALRNVLRPGWDFDFCKDDFYKQINLWK